MSSLAVLAGKKMTLPRNRNGVVLDFSAAAIHRGDTGAGAQAFEGN